MSLNMFRSIRNKDFFQTGIQMDLNLSENKKMMKTCPEIYPISSFWIRSSLSLSELARIAWFGYRYQNTFS